MLQETLLLLHTRVVFTRILDFFLPLTRLLLSGLSDKSVWVWDELRGVELMELKGHANWVMFLSNGTHCYARTSRMRITPYSSRVNVIRLDRASGIRLERI